MKSLREWRISRLESSKTLAVKAGVSNKTILEIENGRNLPLLRTIRRLSEALNVAPEEVTEFAAAMEQQGKGAA